LLSNKLPGHESGAGSSPVLISIRSTVVEHSRISLFADVCGVEVR
jgi:hypothetical protein